jgi:hypothetical protein
VLDPNFSAHHCVADAAPSRQYRIQSTSDQSPCSATIIAAREKKKVRAEEK